MKILGFDPASTKNLGWASIEFDKTAKDNRILNIDCNTHVLATVAEQWMCLWPLQQFVETLLQQKPDLVIIEKTSAFKASFITSNLGNSIGAILAACGKYGVDVKFVYPTHVKKVITGKGKATKSVMKKYVKDLVAQFYGTEVKFTSEHDCDACANLFCWLFDEGIIAYA